MSTDFDSKQGPPPQYNQAGYPPQYNQPYPQQPPQSAGYNQPVGYGYSQNTVVVTQPGVMVAQGQRPPDYLILSIISCCFCWPMAICAIVASCNSQKSADVGNYVVAESEGRTARNIAIAAIVIGVICVAIGIIVRVVVYSSYTTSYTHNYG